MKKFIVAMAALALMAGSAYAADWNFYGSARVATFYSDVETINSVTADTKNIAENLQGNSRIGAKVKVSDELSGRFEYGTSVNVRLLYGVWNFGAGTLLVGQDYVPLYSEGPAQVIGDDNGLIGWGLAYGGRKPQLKLTFGDFEIAAVQPNANYTYGAGSTAGTAGMIHNGGAVPTSLTAAASGWGGDSTYAEEVKLPQIQASYTLRGDNWMVKGFGGFQTFEINTGSATLASQDATSYYLGVAGDITVGSFKLGAQVHGGENAGNLVSVDPRGASIGTTNPQGLAYYDNTTNKVIDLEVFGWCTYLGYTVNDMFGLQIGYGQLKAEYDTTAAQSDEVSSYYLQAPITLAPGVFVIPEVGVYDYEETNQTETTYFGAKWMINF